MSKLRMYVDNYMCFGQTALRTFNDWAERHPKEFLVLALSHFKGMDDGVHGHLLNFIATLFGAKLIHDVV